MDDHSAPLSWKIKSFSELSPSEFEEILQIRQNVFVVEQECEYLDADEWDEPSTHVLARNGQDKLVAYARILPPGAKYKGASIGRILTIRELRNKGLGKRLINHSIQLCRDLYPGADIEISAQYRLQSYYEQYDFVARGEPYDDAGIQHIEMVLAG